jgi:hypothetical protein
MSTQTICDGCGGVATDQRGLIDKLDYCADCAKLVDEFTRRCDDLHTRTAEIWTLGLESIQEEFAEKYPDLRLPNA